MIRSMTGFARRERQGPWGTLVCELRTVNHRYLETSLRLPDELIRTADEVYIRLHGPKRWYRHVYSKDELQTWAAGSKRAGPASLDIFQ